MTLSKRSNGFYYVKRKDQDRAVTEGIISGLL
jgi:hypothetical protein